MPRSVSALISSLTDASQDHPFGRDRLLEGFAFYEQQQADIHPKPHGPLYRTLAKRFPFAIYYDVKDGVATVVAVLDCRQNPASITERLKRG